MSGRGPSARTALPPVPPRRLAACFGGPIVAVLVVLGTLLVLSSLAYRGRMSALASAEFLMAAAEDRPLAEVLDEQARASTEARHEAHIADWLDGAITLPPPPPPPPSPPNPPPPRPPHPEAPWRRPRVGPGRSRYG